MSDRLDPDRLDELWTFSDPQASAGRFRAELAAASPIAAAELTTQLARALGLDDDFVAANALLDGLSATQSREPVVAIRVALERGRLLNSAGSPDAAVPWFTRALDTAVEHDEHFLAADAAHMLAFADRERSAQWTERGIRIVDGTTDDRTKRWGIALHNNRGWVLHDEGHFDEALAEFELADAAAQAFGNPEQQHAAQWAIARCLRSLGRTAEALAIQRRLLAAVPDDAYVLEEIAALGG